MTRIVSQGNLAQVFALELATHTTASTVAHGGVVAGALLNDGVAELPGTPAEPRSCQMSSTRTWSRSCAHARRPRTGRAINRV
jgi:hypothetical protein